MAVHTWMHLLDAWRGKRRFTARASEPPSPGPMTKVSDDHVPDEVYEQARRRFSEKELVDLTAAVIAINAWNRLGPRTRPEPGGQSLTGVGRRVKPALREPACAVAAGLIAPNLRCPICGSRNQPALISIFFADFCTEVLPSTRRS
jgi:hypothetical protein